MIGVNPKPMKIVRPEMALGDWPAVRYDDKDLRSKEELKAAGDYTPRYWLMLKEERGWITKPHGHGIKHKAHRRNLRSGLVRDQHDNLVKGRAA